MNRKDEFVIDENDKISQLLKQDAASINLDDDFLEKSFMRLQAKMNYSKNIIKHQTRFKSFQKWSACIASCAAVFIAVFAPIYFNSSQKFENSIAPIASTSLKPIAKNNIIVGDGIATENLSVAVKSAVPASDNGESEFSKSIENSIVIPKLELQLDEALTSVDIFKERVKVANQNIDFPVLIPETHTVKNNRGEIRMPHQNIIGR